ncbi:Isocitrate dehydrogenase [NAD] subunit 1, mitochondrial [Termitomyces sp. J132]|nr:Isocitrate dehydrogenase [NAD] subunit 1, mitochondrial [Termitomyces sp. J132]
MLRNALSVIARPLVAQSRSYATNIPGNFPGVSHRPTTKYGGVYTVTLIPGDGIGAEITDSVKEIFDHVNAPIEWEQYDVSGMSSSGEALFKQAMESLKRNRVGLKGILFTPISQSGHISWNVAMRQQLDIYASLVLCKSLPGFPTRHSNVDFAIIRENTEGEYSGLEHQSYPGVVESLKVSTRAKAERISRFAFDFALKNNRKSFLADTQLIPWIEYALFEPGCRHVASDIMGTNRANPAAMILSATMMLRHLGLDSIANSIAAATFDVINSGKVRTADMGGSATTSEFTSAVIQKL